MQTKFYYLFSFTYFQEKEHIVLEKILKMEMRYLNNFSKFILQYHRQESSKIPMHAGCGKKRGKDYNSRGNPAKFTRDPRNVSRNSPVSANFTREFFMRDAWKYFPRKIDL